MQLYELSWGIYPRRVIVYLKEKGIAIDRIPIDVVAGENRQPDFLKINPAGTVPVLRLDDGAVICQSLAIIEYLEEQYPDPDLSGSTLLDRARTREMAQAITEAYIYFNIHCGHASPAFRDRFEQSPAVAAFMYQQYRSQLKQINDRMGGGPNLCGDRLSYADCMLFASAQFALLLYKSPVPDDCPNIENLYRRFATRASAAAPEYPEMIAKIAPLPNPGQ